MQPDKNEIRRIVIASLREILQGDGRAEIPAIDDRTDPIRDLGLTSEDGLEVACLLSYRLNFEIPPAVNPFTDDDRRRARRVGEIVDLLVTLLGGNGVAGHA